MTKEKQAKLLEQIRAFRAKAQSTNFGPEREACQAKANQLEALLQKEIGFTKLAEFDSQFGAEMDGTPRHFNIEGKPISFSEWARRFEDRGYQQIVATRKRGILVSTVWLGLNHSFGYGPPMIFETMIFGREAEKYEYQDRYTTLDEALLGHEYACKVAFGWRSRLREALWRFTPEIPMPPVWRWKPPKTWAKPWEKDYGGK